MSDILNVTGVSKSEWKQLLPLLQKATSLDIKEVKTDEGIKDIYTFIDEIMSHLKIQELKSLSPDKKKEAFDKLLNLYTKTGRGLEEMFAKMSGYYNEYLALEQEGEITSILDRNQSKWFYPKDVYCFENESNEIQSLFFMDAYRGEESKWHSIKEIRARQEYIDWKESNKEILIKSFGEEKKI